MYWSERWGCRVAQGEAARVSKEGGGTEDGLSGSRRGRGCHTHPICPGVNSGLHLWSKGEPEKGMDRGDVTRLPVSKQPPGFGLESGLGNFMGAVGSPAQRLS